MRIRIGDLKLYDMLSHSKSYKVTKINSFILKNGTSCNLYIKAAKPKGELSLYCVELIGCSNPLYFRSSWSGPRGFLSKLKSTPYYDEAEEAIEQHTEDS